MNWVPPHTLSPIFLRHCAEDLSVNPGEHTTKILIPIHRGSDNLVVPSNVSTQRVV